MQIQATTPEALPEAARTFVRAIDQATVFAF